MTSETIIEEWKKGHLRKWLYEQKYKSLIYQKNKKYIIFINEQKRNT